MSAVQVFEKTDLRLWDDRYDFIGYVSKSANLGDYTIAFEAEDPMAKRIEDTLAANGIIHLTVDRPNGQRHNYYATSIKSEGDKAVAAFTLRDEDLRI